MFTQLSGLKGLPKLKGLKRLPTLGRQYNKPRLLHPPAALTPPPNLEEQQLAEIMRRANLTRAEAKRIEKLQNQFPTGTLPELITYDWLSRNGYQFSYQAVLFGGRTQSGGVLPDFVVGMDHSRAYAWNIQGTYWHSIANGRDKPAKDASDLLRMIGQIVDGRRIVKAMELWESTIYTRRPGVFEYALSGIEIGQ